MAVEHVKSQGVTNTTAEPPVPNTAGENGHGRLVNVEGYAVAVASSSQDSTYEFVRVPSNAKIKSVRFESAAQGGGTVDIGVYRVDEAVLAANAVDQNLFADAIAVTAASGPTDVTNESTTYTIDKRQMPIWEAAGLTEDPRVDFLVVGTINGAITTGTGLMGLSVDYVI